MRRPSPITFLRNLGDALSTLTLVLKEGTRPPYDLLETTRRHWARDGRLRIDADATMRIDRDGTWVSAWVLAGDIAPIDPQALLAARRSLPLFTREVYRLLSEERLTYRQIAVRLGISVEEVREHVTAALRQLEAAAGL